ncbi:hypothetical protein COOONC_11672 [Cooperia oncophora]
MTIAMRWIISVMLLPLTKVDMRSEHIVALAALVTETDLLQEFGADKGDTFLASLISEDPDFRLVYVLWRWCLSGASESKGGVRRTYINRTVNGKKVGPDPDSMLSAPEDPNFEKLVRVVFSLLRCGRFEEAMILGGDMHVPWLIPLIRSQQLLVDSSLISAELTKQERARFHFRKLFFQTMVKAISETKYTMGIRMVFAALAGDWQFLLPLAVNVDDRLWCYANAAVQARLNAALGIEHPIFAPTTVQGIFEAIATESHGKNLIGRMIEVMRQKQAFSLIPFYAALLPKDDGLRRIWNVMPDVKSDGDRIAFIAALNDAGFDGEEIAYQCGRFRIVEMVDHADLLRWIFACGDKKLLEAITEANSVLRHYFCKFPLKLEGSKPNGTVESSTLYSAVSDMEDDASALISKCEQLKLVDRLGALVKNENDDESADWGTMAGIAIDEFNCHCLYLTAQTHSTNFAMECARALEAKRRKAEDERECNEWSRQGDLVGLSQRTARAEHNQTLVERSKLALDACKARTFDAILAFVRHPGWRTETKGTAQTHSTNFAMECARALEAKRRKAEDERECNEWSRQGDLVGLSQRTARAEHNQTLVERSKLALDACKARTFDAILAFVRHPGWRTETKGEWGRSEQLKALREKYYASMLNVLLRDLGMCNDAETILDILTELTDENLEFYKDLSKTDLSRFLLDVHTLAGHILG